MKEIAKILICASLVLITPLGYSQILNLSNFDKNTLHYGISVGYMQSKFVVDYTEDDAIRDKIQGVTSYYIHGFHISIIGDLRINDYMNLRLIPGISFVDRELSYALSDAFASLTHTPERKRFVESVYGDLPLELKLRSQRWNNFRPYIITGVKYGFDFASLKNNKNRNDESIIRLASSDFSYLMGAGFDFYFQYFKFAIELKMGFGLVDLLIPDDTYYTQSINSINSRSFVLSITVEG